MYNKWNFVSFSSMHSKCNRDSAGSEGQAEPEEMVLSVLPSSYPSGSSPQFVDTGFN